MKKVCLFLLLFAFSILSFGQEAYKSFLEEGKVWKYHYFNTFTGKEFDNSMTIGSDTIINDKSYKKIIDVATGSYLYAVREDGKKVFFKYLNEEALVYDFGLNVGDTFPLCRTDTNPEPSDWAKVVAVDTIVVSGRSFRALDVRTSDDSSFPNWWVEGIGSWYLLDCNFLTVGNCYAFVSCQLGEDTIFSQGEFNTLGVQSVTVENKNTPATSIYDILGRRLSSTPSKGVYIQNGRKKIVK